MGIVNGPAPEGRATGATDWMTSITMERDALQVQLQQSEQLRQEAFAVCGAMRLELAKVTQELTAVTLDRDEWKAAVEYQQRQATQLRQQIVRLRNDWGAEMDERKALQEQVTELQAQLETAAVTPAQQPDGTAERLERVRRMIGEIWGWYACVECLGEQSAETWEQAGALLGRLQREAN